MSVIFGPRPVRRGGMDIVDAQLHLSLDAGAKEIAAAMDALGIRSVMLDELWGRNDNDQGTPCVQFQNGAYRPLSPYAQAAAIHDPQRYSFLQRVTPHDPDLRSLIPILASSPGCRSLRLVLRDRQQRQEFAAGAYDEMLGMAQAYSLPLSVLSKDSGSVMRNLVPRFPDLQFIIDHCGWGKTEADWNAVLDLARYPNTFLKWSHAHRAFGYFGEPRECMQRELLRALDTYGVERVLWASDVTHEETGASWLQLLSFIQDNPALSPGDKEWILGRTARRVFRWEARAGSGFSSER